MNRQGFDRDNLNPVDSGSIPRKISELVNDSGFVTEEYVDGKLPNIDEKADKTAISGMQQQIDNLKVNSSQESSNAEVIQARDEFNTLDERLDNMTDKTTNLQELESNQNKKLEEINKRNDTQDIYIKGLLNESVDAKISVYSELGNYTPLLESVAGLSTVDEITGNTLVNRVSEENRELVLNDEINKKGINVTISDTVDDSLVDVMCEGKTMVNVCDQEDPIPLTKSYTVETGNHVALQGEYDGKAKPVIYGNTMVNRITEAKTLKLNDDVNESGQFITTDACVDGGLVDVMCEGNTLVNVSKTKSDAHVTKKFADIVGNEGVLTGSQNGFIEVDRVVGDTMVNNLVDVKSLMEAPVNNSLITREGNKFTFTKGNSTIGSNLSIVFNHTLKDQTTYTISLNITHNDFTDMIDKNDIEIVRLYNIGIQNTIKTNTVGKVIFTFTTNFSNATNPNEFWVGVQYSNGTFADRTGSIVIEDIMVLEGDYRNKPIPTYFEGIQSSYEDKKCKNLFDGQLEAGYFNSVGDKIAGGGFRTVNDISVKASTSYILSGDTDSGNMYLNEIDKQGNCIQQITIKPGASFTTSSTTNTVRFNTDNGATYFNNGQLEEGTMVTEYEPYKPGYKVELKTHGKNLLNLSSSINNVNSGVTYKYNSSNDCIDITGTSTSNYSVSPSIYLKGEVGKLYRISSIGDDQTAGILAVMSCRRNGVTEYYTSTKSEAMNWTEDCSEFKFYIQVSNAGTVCNHSIKVQIEEVATTTSPATTYEPYFEDSRTLYIDEPLRRGDFVYSEALDRAYMSRNMKQRVLDGSDDEAWAMTEPMQIGDVTLTNAKMFTLTLDDMKVSWGNREFQLIHDRLLFDMDGVYWGSKYNTIANFYERICIIVDVTTLPSQDVAGFKAWLKANPVTIVYQLASMSYSKIEDGKIYLGTTTNTSLITDSNIPLSSMSTKNYVEKLTYLQPSTNYVVTFTSSQAYTGADLSLGGTVVYPTIVKGYNKVLVTTNTAPTNILFINGQFDISNVVVSTQEPNAYFEGMKSVGQDDVNGHSLEIMSANGNVNLFKNNTGWYDGGMNNTSYDKESCTLTITNTYAFKNVRFNNVISKDGIYTISFKAKSTDTNTLTVDLVDKNATTFKIDTTEKEFSITTDTETTVAYNPAIYHFIDFYIQGNSSNTVTISNIKIEKGDSKTPFNYLSDKKQFSLSEPLRGLPNGVKDRFVKKSGKWYVERNCIDINLKDCKFNTTTSDTSNIRFDTSSQFKDTIKSNISIVCDKLVPTPFNNKDGVQNAILMYDDHVMRLSNISGVTSLSELNSWISTNDVHITTQRATPTYEEITDFSLTTYLDTTHISNNSIIPCNMTVRNTGYDAILKPSTKYTLQGNATGFRVANTLVASTIGYTETVIEDVIRPYGKGKTITNPMLLEGDVKILPSESFLGMKSTFDTPNENGKYPVVVKSVGKNLFGDEILGGMWGGSGELYWSEYWKCKNFIQVIPNTTYTLSYKYLDVAPGDGIYNAIFVLYDKDKNYILTRWTTTMTIPSDCHYIRVAGQGTKGSTIDISLVHSVQLEVGKTVTEYEPYKESYQTILLNSPLLEGDQIISKNGKLKHIHNYGKKVLDGTETDWQSGGWSRDGQVELYGHDIKGVQNYITCNILPTKLFGGDCSSYANSIVVNNLGRISLFLERPAGVPNNLPSNIDYGKQWVSENLPTIVYKLATPWEEDISEGDFYVDSYVNGHLVLDSVIPVEKVEFKYTDLQLKYLYPSTSYTVQFEADNVGVCDINLGGNSLKHINIIKGINKLNISTNENNVNYIIFYGIGCNISNVVVTETIDEDVKYFKGMKSVAQDEGNVIEVKSQNKNEWQGATQYINTNSTMEKKEDNECIYAHNKINQGIRVYIGDYAEKNISISYDVELLEGSTLNWGGHCRHSQLGYYIDGVQCGTTTGNSYHNGEPINLELNRTYHIDFIVKIGYVSNVEMDYKYIGIEPNRYTADTPTYAKVKITNFQIVEGNAIVPYIAPKTDNKQISLSEPLRSLPNGIKDKFVKRNGKWYVERNCIEVDLSTVADWKDWGIKETDYFGVYAYINGLEGEVNELEPNVYCNTRPGIANLYIIRNSEGVGIHTGWGDPTGYLAIGFKKTELTTLNSEGVVQWIKDNPTYVVAQLKTPKYEEIIDMSLIAYLETTHISNNSNIPCNMTVKNTGLSLNGIRTLSNYTLVYNASGEIRADVCGNISANLFNGKDTVSSNVLLDNDLRLYGKGKIVSNVMLLDGEVDMTDGNFEGMKSCFDCEQVADETDDNYGKYAVSIKIRGKNLFDKTRIQYNRYQNFYIDGNLYTIVENSSYNTTGFIEVQPNMQYTKTNLASGVFYNKDKEPIKGVVIDTDTFTTPYNCKYVVLNMTNATDFNTSQLEQGEKNTSYESYYEDVRIIYLNSPLLEGDKLVSKGNGIYHIHNCEQIVLDGAKDYTSHLAGGNYFFKYALERNISESLTVPLLSDKLLDYGNYDSMVVTENSMYSNSTHIHFRLNNDFINNAGVKEYLQSNPIKVVCKLSEPYEEKVYDNLFALAIIDNCNLTVNSIVPINSITNTYSTSIPSIYSLDNNVGELQTVSDEQDQLAFETAYRLTVVEIMTGISEEEL